MDLPRKEREGAAEISKKTRLKMDLPILQTKEILQRRTSITDPTMRDTKATASINSKLTELEKHRIFEQIVSCVNRDTG